MACNLQQWQVNSVFTENLAFVDGSCGGGAVFAHPTGSGANAPSYSIENSEFVGNVASHTDDAQFQAEPDVGAILIKPDLIAASYSVKVSDSEFRQNQADGHGGAVSL